MDASGLFMKWAALSTPQQHQHEHPPVLLPDQLGFGHSAASLDCIVSGRPPARDARQWTATSWTSCDTNSGWGGGNGPIPAVEHDGLWTSRHSVMNCANQPMSWGFDHSAASPRLSNEAMPIKSAAAANNGGGGDPQIVRQPPPTRIEIHSAKGSRHPASAPCAQAHDHTIAERKRRERMRQRLIELAAVIPGLTKTDKATILADAVRYVKELQERVRALEDGSNDDGRSFPAVLAKKPRIGSRDDDVDVVMSHVPAGHTEVDARISGNNVMVRILCKDAKGVLAKLLAEVEGLHLTIVVLNTNIMPFPSCTMMINIVAKVEEGLNSKADDIVGRLNSALHQHCRQNSTDRILLNSSLHHQVHLDVNIVVVTTIHAAYMK